MSTQPENLNYPDFLGLITNNRRLNIDVIQCALATRPSQTAAGQNLEMLFLIQNASDIDVDVTVQLNLPNQDAEGKKAMFFSKSARLLVGLQPAEVGYVTLPVSCSPKTAPGVGYRISADIKVERVDKSRKPTRIRQADGGGKVMLDLLTEQQRRTLVDLRTLHWATEAVGRNRIETTFEVLPPKLSTLIEFKADWRSLWTMKDYIDETVVQQRVQEHLDVVIPQFVKEKVFKPLIEACLEWFQKASYPLKTAEAIYITKLLTLVLCEVAIEKPSRINPNPVLPHWYKQLMYTLLQEPRLRDFPDQLLKTNLFPDLIFDSILYGFKMVHTVLNEDFGTPEDMENYANDIRKALRNGTKLNYGQVYLPLIAGGIIANTRITMKGENIRETLFAISKAHESRQSEYNEDNAFVTEMVNKLIERDLDFMATNDFS